jgi:hypothetical protein
MPGGLIVGEPRNKAAIKSVGGSGLTEATTLLPSHTDLLYQLTEYDNSSADPEHTLHASTPDA